MSLQEFLQNDIFRNTLVATPRFEFKIYNGKVVSINNTIGGTVGDSLNIKDLPVATYGIFNFSLQEQSFNISLI